jgi:tetratricopeptide (TPR) repeat protein
MSVMLRYFGIPLLVFCAGLALLQAQQPSDPKAPPQNPAKNPISADQLPANEAPPRSDDGQTASEASNTDDRNISSSRANIIDLSPPKDDLKNHPDSAAAIEKANDQAAADANEVQEFRPWNPMKALKDIEVGDYYFKKKNYRAALDRYKEALVYKENDAVATYRLAVCQEEMGDSTNALNNYAAYLKILPHGPFAADAQESVERLTAETPKGSTASGKKETAAKEVAPEKP